jgi:bifunctional non-homologous end joining protein LigD
MRIERLAAGFIIPARPVRASKAPVGVDWVHEINHDDYRIIVRRDGPTVRLYSRNAHDRTATLSAVATAARRIKAKSFAIDGEAVVLGLGGLSLFDELRRREAADTAILYAFDLIEHDGEDMRDRRFLDHKAALARLLCNSETGILFNEHIAGDARLRARLPAWRRGHRVEEGRQHLSIRPMPSLDQGPRSRQHRRAAGRGAKFGIDEAWAVCARAEALIAYLKKEVRHCENRDMLRLPFLVAPWTR